MKRLIEYHPGGLTKEQIARDVGYAPTSGSFNNSLSRLRTLELIVGRNNEEIKASEVLF